MTPLDAAMSNPEREVVITLINAGAVRNGFGLTPLMLAAGWQNNAKTIIALLNAGADVNAKGEDGKRAIDYAKENENIVWTAAYRQLEAASK